MIMQVGDYVSFCGGFISMRLFKAWTIASHLCDNPEAIVTKHEEGSSRFSILS